MKHIPVLDKKYGEFTVISTETQKTKDNKIQFKVRCSCGNEQYVRAYFLESRRQDCCKSCSQRRALHKYESRRKFLVDGHKGVGNFTKTFYNHYKLRAKVRDIDWKVSIEYLWNLYLKQDKKCALTGLVIGFSTERINCNPDYSKITASLDRIDSNGCYEEGNVQWIHKDVNRMKNAYDQNYFIEICNLVSKHGNHEPSSTNSSREGAETSGFTTVSE